jgi:hypothetical protein
MPAVTPPPYPTSLKVSSWNKAKGLIARISGVKTGVTEELEKAAELFKKAPFDEVNITPNLNKFLEQAPTSDKLKVFQHAYLEKYHPKFKALESGFLDLHLWLVDKAKEFEKDEKLAKFAPVVKLMAEDANKFRYAVAWGTVSDENQKDLQKSINDMAEVEKMKANAIPKLKKMISDASTEVNKYKTKSISKDDYGLLWKEQLRGIGAQIKSAAKIDPSITEKFAVPMKTAVTQWAQGNLPKKDEDTKGQIKEDIELVKKFKDISDKL